VTSLKAALKNAVRSRREREWRGGYRGIDRVVRVARAGGAGGVDGTVRATAGNGHANGRVDSRASIDRLAMDRLAWLEDLQARL